MISVTALQQNSKTIYVGLLSTLTVFLLMDYIPVLASFSQWVTPPVSLFLGLIFALVCGQAYPKFNKKVSKYLLQYSVVGLGFGMNLQASLASGKEGMEFRLSGNFWLVSFKISYLCLPLFYETRTTPSCHPSGCAYRQL